MDRTDRDDPDPRAGHARGAARIMSEAAQPPAPSAPCPVHRAEDLLNCSRTARILLGEKTYLLRLTRAGKLILTK
ncbi:hemin uptake protein HemP [uncultured Jannaschia sp.]|uniref:hemin uptake protein HemP n=1 Tax=uncultured Jannaschia sp. TaxID=293347 RepID=UPI0026150594|nr:hemin uptake protein HemP [uncultured Jannaschia sp.]